VRVEGLETMDYLDNLKAKERFTEQGDAIVFESEVSVFDHVKSLFFHTTLLIQLSTIPCQDR
jgi:hypothetical protein